MYMAFILNSGQLKPRKGTPGDRNPGPVQTLVVGSVEGHGCSTKQEKLSCPQARVSFQSLVILA